MKAQYFWKYTKRAIVLQLLLCAAIWAAALLVYDDIFGLMFYLYYPTIYLFDALAGASGEAGMFSTIIYGMLIGMIIYAAILGGLISYFKRPQDHAN